MDTSRYHSYYQLTFLIMPSNNNYDRSLPANWKEAELAKNRKEARNALALIQHHEHRKQLRKEALRAQHINPHDIF